MLAQSRTFFSCRRLWMSLLLILNHFLLRMVTEVHLHLLQGTWQIFNKLHFKCQRILYKKTIIIVIIYTYLHASLNFKSLRHNSYMVCHTMLFVTIREALRDDQNNSSVSEWISVCVRSENLLSSFLGLEECGKMKLLSGKDLEFCVNWSFCLLKNSCFGLMISVVAVNLK